MKYHFLVTCATGDIGQELCLYLAKKGHDMTITALAAKLDIPYPKLYRMLKHNSPPTGDLLVRLINCFPMINPLWLYTGQTPMLLSDDELSEQLDELLDSVKKEETIQDCQYMIEQQSLRIIALTHEKMSLLTELNELRKEYIQLQARINTQK